MVSFLEYLNRQWRQRSACYILPIMSDPSSYLNMFYEEATLLLAIFCRAHCELPRRDYSITQVTADVLHEANSFLQGIYIRSVGLITPSISFVSYKVSIFYIPEWS